MTPTPPRLATWILRLVARDNDALVGDLLEEFDRRRSRTWYWQQVAHASFVGGPRVVTLALLVIVVYLAGRYIPIPGATNVVRSLATQRSSGPGPWQPFTVFFLGGGELSWGTIFTLGINPYISAAFLVQIVQVIWSTLRRNAPHRRRLPIPRITWSVAILLCLAQAGGFAAFLERASLGGSATIVPSPGWAFRIATILTLTAGTTLLMLLSDQITKHQMGNGMLIVFLAGTLAASPGIVTLLLSGAIDPFSVVGILCINTAIASIASYGYQRALAREMTI